MTAGDFNHDGIRDLAIGAENARLYILLGVSDGTFVRQPPMTLIPGGDLISACNDVDVADFNGDTFQDLVVALGNGHGNVVLLGNGDGTFRQSFRITENAVSAPLNLAVADFNGDGLQDIARAMGDGSFGLMEIANGNGDGTFQAPVRYLVPPSQSSMGGIFITASDFNGDGKPDVALAVGGASTTLYVLINSTGTPPPATISSLSLNPSTITGGSSSTGTVTLSAKVQTATAVALASNNSAARVPSSVTVAAGASSANFTVNTTQVSTQRTATITATLNNTSRSASLTIKPAADTVSITRAEYESSKRTLRVEATCSRSTSTLQGFVTSSGVLIGTLTNNGGGKYSGQFSLATNPQSITVRSNGGGQATRTVSVK
jgi:VCBS repeat protein/FG-GAP repeat protein